MFGADWQLGLENNDQGQSVGIEIMFNQTLLLFISGYLLKIVKIQILKLIIVINHLKYASI